MNNNPPFPSPTMTALAITLAALTGAVIITGLALSAFVAVKTSGRDSEPETR